MKHIQSWRTRQRGPQPQSFCGIMAAAALAAAGLAPSHAAPAPPHGVIAGNIDVTQLGFENPSSNISIRTSLAIGDFRIRSSANRGDYDVQIGEVLGDDVAGGVLITSLNENGGRASVDQFGNPDPIYPGLNTATTHIDYSRTGANAGGYFIPVAMTYPSAGGNTVVEWNMNVAAAWFPYDRYLGAFARNGGDPVVNGGPNDLINSSPSIVAGTHFIDLGGGRATVNLTSLGINSQTDGVLLAIGAKNEDNYALSLANPDGTWTLFSKDNGTDTTSLEPDPFAFVYIPKNDPYLTSGRFNGDGSVIIAGGTFTITVVGEGQWELKIPGQSPSTGVLLTSPEGGMSENRDNVVSAAPNAARDGWIIESRDLPSQLPPGDTLAALETPGDATATQPVASFVFVPGATPGISITPTQNIFTSENQTQVVLGVVLDTAPTAPVTLALTSDDSTEGVLLNDTVTFTPEDWNVPHNIVLIGEDDGDTDGPVTFNLVFAAATSDDTIYNGMRPANIAVINLDNDGGVTVVPTGGLATTEAGATATFTVQLDRAPTADVVIPISSSNIGEATVSPSSLTFTAADWNVPQTVTVTGVNDAIDDGDASFSIVTGAAQSADAFFNAKNPADVTGTNADDDTAGINVSPVSGLTVVEGQSGTFAITLASQPRGDVTFTFASSNPAAAQTAAQTVTITPATWNETRNVVVNGTDDLLDDGSTTFIISSTVASTDATYAAIVPLNVNGTTLDNEAALAVFSEGLVYGTGMPAMNIAGRATIADPNTANYAGGTLRVALTQNASASDVLAIRNVGTGEGQIGVNGTSVTYSNVEIGTVSGGQGNTPLSIALNTSATPAATEALLRAITFATATENPSTALRALTIALTDADGGVSDAQTTIRVGLLRMSNFQEGADHGYGVYSGGKDIELYELQPDSPRPTGRGTAGRLFLDWRDADSPNTGQILMRFDNIIGDSAGQIPANAIVVSAELFLEIVDSGDGSPLYRMLVPWDENNATWNSVGGGITPDDVRARTTYESQIGLEDGSGSTTVGNVWVSVTPDVQAWVSGEANHGWVMPAWPLRLDGTGISPSEAPDINVRPRLRVKWLPANSATVASFRQGVDGYAGVTDTRIQQGRPDDLTHPTAATLFVDAVVISNIGDNPEQVLIRFDEIIGNQPGQIPAGSRIEAAILDVASLNGDAMGDGGQIFAIVKPWPEILTWNGWENGVQTNGVEALATPTVLLGNETLNPDVQGGFLSFDLTKDVQGWVSGTIPQQGWMMNPWPNGGNGWGFFSSENATERNRPRLRVYYTAGTPQPAEIRLGQPVYNAATGVQLNFTGEPNQTYRVRRAATVDGQLGDIGPATTNAQGAGTFTDNAAPATAAFYVISSQ